MGNPTATKGAWEIKLYGTDFKTEAAAKLAGEKALVAFLDGLAKEERNA